MVSLIKWTGPLGYSPVGHYAPKKTMKSVFQIVFSNRLHLKYRF